MRHELAAALLSACAALRPRRRRRPRSCGGAPGAAQAEALAEEEKAEQAAELRWAEAAAVLLRPGGNFSSRRKAGLGECLTWPCSDTGRGGANGAGGGGHPSKLAPRAFVRLLGLASQSVCKAALELAREVDRKPARGAAAGAPDGAPDGALDGSEAAAGALEVAALGEVCEALRSRAAFARAEGEHEVVGALEQTLKR